MGTTGGAELSIGITFLWGCVGGFVAFALIFALPEARRAYASRRYRFTWARLAVALVMVTLYVGLGGAAAVMVGGAIEPKHAIAYGLGFEGILGGFLKGATS